MSLNFASSESHAEHSMETRIASLISQMTLAEKIDCLSTCPDVPRLGIKGSSHVEGLHGLALGGPGKWGGDDPIPTTTFPQAVGLGRTWDPDLIERVAEAEAIEARFAFHQLGRGGLVVRAPNADLARDPRWGRTEECFGEDPYLVGQLAAAFVRGLQGKHPKYWRTAALLKHFLANSTEDGRLDTSADIDQRMIREYYARSFEVAVREGGARSFMAAYNAVNSVPCTVHELLGMTRSEWGVDGIICTDACALEMLVTKHHYFEDIEVAAAACIKAGITQFLDDYRAAIEGALSRQLIVEEDIERAITFNFRTMMRLGLFEPPDSVPFAGVGEGRSAPPAGEEHQKLAREAAARSIVLLKNEGEMLPFDPAQLRSIAVIGPLADRVLFDWYGGSSPYWVGLLQALRGRVAPQVEVLSAVTNDTSEAILAARRADICIVCVGNHPTGDDGWEKVTRPSYGKEAVDRKSLTLEEEKLVEEVFKANPRTVLALFASFPYAINWSNENVPAIVLSPHGGQELGNGLCDVLFGDENPAGRLVMTWPRSLEDLPPLMDFDLKSGRTYMYAEKTPLYPFGFGLSYTKFAYGTLETSSDTLTPEEPLSVSFDLSNIGGRSGEEVVQLYVERPSSKLSTEKKRLCAFRRVPVLAGETVRVTLQLDARELRYFDAERGKWLLEAGEAHLLVGSSSAQIFLQKSVAVVVR
jgi:beta-glucosidase